MRKLLDKNCMIQISRQLSKREIIEAMAAVFDRQGFLCDRQGFFQDVLAREKIFSTSIGYGIAVPHGKSKTVKKSGICVAKLRYAVQWNDDMPGETWLVILLAVKEGEEQETHLEVLKRLCYLLMHEDFRKRVSECEANQLYDCLQEYLEVD